jgi:hypothetical protein
MWQDIFFFFQIFLDLNLNFSPLFYGQFLYIYLLSFDSNLDSNDFNITCQLFWHSFTINYLCGVWLWITFFFCSSLLARVATYLFESISPIWNKKKTSTKFACIYPYFVWSVCFFVIRIFAFYFGFCILFFFVIWNRDMDIRSYGFFLFFFYFFSFLCLLSYLLHCFAIYFSKTILYCQDHDSRSIT